MEEFILTVLVCTLLIANTVAVFQNRKLKRILGIKDIPLESIHDSGTTEHCAMTLSTKCVVDPEGFVLEDTLKKTDSEIEAIKKHIGLN